MSLPPARLTQIPSPPRLENLEERLLLTTLIIPDGGEEQYFLYHNTQGDTVRVSFNGSPGDSIELLGTGPWDDDVVDLVGIMNGNVSPDGIVTWPGGSYTDIVDFSGQYPTWQELSELTRGSRTDIYAIYVAKCSSNTVLSLSTLSSNAIGGPGTDYGALSTWSSTPPTLFWSSGSASSLVPVEGWGTNTAPSDSGGVVVGAVFVGIFNNTPTYRAVYNDDPRAVGPMGVFPGGALRPGITVAQATYDLITDDSAEGQGNDVRAIAVDSDSKIYTVDSGVFNSDAYTDESSFGQGLIVDSLAADSAGTFYSVDNARGTIIKNGDGFGYEVDGLAIDSEGRFFAFDNDYAQAWYPAGPSYPTILWRSLEAASQPVLVGYVRDANQPALSYTVVGMDFDDNGDLYAIATAIDMDTYLPPAVPGPAGPYLIKIDTATAQAHRLGLLSGETDLIGMAFDDSGNLWGLDDDGNLIDITIDPLVCPATVHVALSTSSINAIEFHEGSLYGVSDTNIFLINSTSGACLDLGPTGAEDLTSLAGDPNDPDNIWTVTTDVTGGGYYQPMRISLDSAGKLLVGDSTGAISATYPLIDASNGDLAYYRVHALDFDGSTLYGIGQAIDTDFSDGNDTPTGVFILRIDTATGLVTNVSTLSGATDLSGIAFDSSGALFGVAPSTNTLYSVNIGTGAATSLGGVVAGIVGIEFVSIGGHDVLFGIVQSGTNQPADLYAVNPANGASTLLGTTNFLNASGLAFSESDPNHLWMSTSLPDTLWPTYGRGLHIIADVPLYGQLVISDLGTISDRLQLKDSVEPAFTFQVEGMDFNSQGVLHAFAKIVSIDPVNVATPSPAGPYLVTIDTETGEVTRLASVDAPSLSTLACYDIDEFFPLDTIFGVDLKASTATTVSPSMGTDLNNVAIDYNGEYWTLTDGLLTGYDPAFGVFDTYTVFRDPAEIDNDTPTITYSGFVALESDAEGGLWTVGTVSDSDPVNDPSYPGTGPWLLRLVRTVDGDGLPVVAVYVMADLFGWTPTSIAFNGNTLYGVDASTGYDVYGIDQNTGNMTLLASLDPSLYITGIDFIEGFLYGVTDSHLYLIDTGTEQVTDLGDVGTTGMVGLANNPTDPTHLFAMRVDGTGNSTVIELGFGNRLITVGLDGAVTRVADITDSRTGAPIFAITGMDFVDGEIYAVTNYEQARAELPGGLGGLGYSFSKHVLYEISAIWGQATALTWLWPEGGLTSLAADPNEPTTFYTTDLVPGSDLTDAYHLGKVTINGVDMGKVCIAGTLAGRADTLGNVSLFYMGFLWGNIYAGKSIGNVILREGGGAVVAGGVTWYLGNGSVIDAGETVTMVESRGADSGTEAMYTAVHVMNNMEAPPRSNLLMELEVATVGRGAVWSDGALSLGWRLGYLVDYTNDAMVHAQYLSHPTGDFTLTGTLGGYVDYQLPYVLESLSANPDGSTYEQDWYALPLMAGQTIVVNGSLGPLNYVRLYDSDSRWMDSFGYETVEDAGRGSGGTTLKAMTFTAPAAGVYYLCVLAPYTWGTDYELYFTNATAAELGGVNVVGDYIGSLNTANRDNPLSGTIAVMNGGDLGGVTISGLSRSMDTYARGGGDIIAFQAAQIGVDTSQSTWVYYLDYISSEGNIGRVASMVGSIFADIEAGANNGAFNHNAYIQNIYSAQHLLTYGETTNGKAHYISASGSIGVIDIVADLVESLPFDIFANSDGIGDPGRIDLIDVGGTCLLPRILTGPGGDVGYIHIGGEIWRYQEGRVREAVPTVISDGSSRTITDDGGGKITITPARIPILDAQGFQTGEYISRYAYTTIGINDVYQGGAGGVIANLSVEGSVTISVDGKVQISDLDLSSSWIEGVGLAADENRPTTMQVTFQGNSANDIVDIYYLHDDPETAENDFTAISLTNRTSGDLLCGNVTATIDTLHIGGSLGRLDDGSTGAWLHGTEAAPEVAAESLTVEPQYGWYHGRMNGLTVTGDVNRVWVGGSLGDLRVIGRLRNVDVNADGVTPDGDWDGVNGLVWSQTRIDDISVGDGLADDGSSDLAQAAIMCTNSIGRVSTKGPRREIVPPPWLDVNERLKGVRVFGELNGSIIGQSNQDIESVDDLGNVILDANGNPVMVEVDAIGRVVGTNGATCTALVLSCYLDAFRCYQSGTYFTGGIGTVTFSGGGAELNGAEVSAQYIRRVTTSADSNGINNSRISTLGSVLKTGVGEVVAGGPGMYNTAVYSAGGSIGIIRGEGERADIRFCSFTSDDGLVSISARNIYENHFSIPTVLGSFSASGDVYGLTPGGQTASIGTIRKMVVGGDFRMNDFLIARSIDSMVVGGSFIDSRLILSGPDMANLKSLIVTGGISGTIISYGRIGSIVSKTGSITANITTVEGGWDNDVDLIDAAGGYTGQLRVAGSLKKLVSRASLGSNPEDVANGRSQTIEVGKDFDYLRVTGSPGTAHLYANVNVGGNIGTMDIDGTLYGNVTTNGNLNKLVLDGSLGGQLDYDHDGDLEDVGSLTVFGAIKSMKFNPSTDIYADLTVGGTIARLALNNANIRGNITIRYGSIGSIKLSGGSILGDVTAKSIGKIAVTGGNITGDIAATDGKIGALAIKSGNLAADVSAEGTIDVLSIVGGSATGGHVITAGAGFGKIAVTGSLAADVVSGRGIGSLAVKGGNLSGAVSAETVIPAVVVDGAITGSIRSGSGIGNLQAGSLSGATISSAWNLGVLKITVGVTDSFILAGYDAGADGVVGGGDDNPITGDVHSGNIESLTIGGVLSGSIVAGGVGPGDLSGGAYAAFLDIADNTEASGASSIRKVVVGGGFGPDQSGVLADTSVDPVFVAGAGALVTIDFGVSHTESGTGTDFGPGTANGPILSLAGLALTLTGEGVANYNAATHALVLEHTTDNSKLNVVGTMSNPITITSSDDSGLASLTTGGSVRIGNADIDGAVKMLEVLTISTGASWNLPGGVSSAAIATPANATIAAGNVGTLTMTGAFSGSLTADAVASLVTASAVSGDLTTLLGDAGTVKIGGAFGGEMTVRGSVKALAVAGALSGDVTVSNGDLLKVAISGGLSGVVDVARGMTKNAALSGGDFSGSYRTSAGIGAFGVMSGNFSGLLSTRGDLGALKAPRGQISGRAWSGGNIKTVAVAGMSGGLVAASGDLAKVAISGDMTSGYLFSGFNPGDAGYISGETGNLRIDRFVAPSVDEQVDQAQGGSIKLVTIGGSMTASAVSAALDPGADGYVGTADDEVAGVGYVQRVKVRGGIFGNSAGVSQSYGVFAASGMPTVTCYGQPFQPSANASYGSMESAAGNLTVTNVEMTTNQLMITFNHAVNFGTVSLSSTMSLYVSTDLTFDPATDTDLAGYLRTPVYDGREHTITLTLKSGNLGTWDSLETKAHLGRMFQLTLDGTVESVDGDGAVLDNRGSVLDGEFTGSFPSGDGVAGGNFVYTMMGGDRPDTFAGALDTDLLPLVLDGGSMVVSNSIESIDDVDVFHFTADAHRYFSMEYLGPEYVTIPMNAMGLFFRDTQGTDSLADDTFEAVTRIEYGIEDFGNTFLAVELPETGEYFVAVAWLADVPTSTYRLKVTLASSDSALLADLGGSLPAREQIAYVSNTVGENSNYLNGNDPKQLVYLDFDGGTATKYGMLTEYGFWLWPTSVRVDALDLAQLDPSLAGDESVVINGNSDVTGIVDNMIAIYSNTPDSNPLGKLTVRRIDLNDPGNWADYQAASEGLWLTTDDPALKGLDPNVDFTTVFVGRADDRIFGGGLLGIASTVDLANMSKADNTIIFTNYMFGFSLAGSVTARLNEYSRALANIAAHEMGHVLGLQHHPTDRYHYRLMADDPDNDPATPDDSNRGVSLMAYSPDSVVVRELFELGTANVSPGEFPIGQIDHADQLLHWLS